MAIPPNLPFDPAGTAVPPASPAPVTPPPSVPLAPPLVVPPPVPVASPPVPPVTPPPAPPPVAMPAPAPQIQAMPVLETASATKGPVDMFAGLEKPKMGRPALAPLPVAESGSVGKYAVIALLVLLVVILAGGGFWYFGVYRPAQERALKTIQPIINPVVPEATAPIQPTTNAIEQVPVTNTEVLGNTPTPEVVFTPPVAALEGSTVTTSFVALPPPVTVPPANTNIPLPTSVAPTVDADQDGLADQREVELGTDPQNKDTDADTVSDGDEVLVYSTNPLNADTDGDGYQDGVEIQKGYNPRGAGKCIKPTCEL